MIYVVDEDKQPIPKYEMMCACLDSDVQTAEGSGASYLKWLQKVERGELEFVDVDGNGWISYITPQKVWFEGLYSQGEGGEVSFKQFKFALETYIRYLADPQRKPIEVEFPEP